MSRSVATPTAVFEFVWLILRPAIIQKIFRREERFQECSTKEGVALETSDGTPGVDLRTRTEQLGEGEGEEKKV